MESKRKVNGGAVSPGDDLDDRAAKRRKLPSDNTDFPQGETTETTTQNGLKLLAQVKKTVDKNGRQVSTDFLKLPSKRDFPDYYKSTKMPIALDTIETKLESREFPTLTTLESYFKRMVQNAKDYNERGSTIYEDAERIRKAVSNYMVKMNPAYKTPGYVAFPTPLPGESEEDSDEDAEGDPESEEEALPTSKRRGRQPKNGKADTPRSSATPARSISQYADVGYEGLTFQQAQEKIVDDLLTQKEFPEDDFVHFAPFVDLPPKALKDYYKMIPNPISLTELQKRVKGVKGKKGPPQGSDFKTWAAFEEEASYLWRNAWHYNEDESEISELARTLQSTFRKLLKEAKEAVPEPAGPKIKLKLAEAPKITLKFPGGKASPAESPAPPTNGSGSSNAGANGTSRRNPFSNPVNSATPVPATEQAGSTAGSATSPTPSNPAPVKNEEARDSPVINGIRSGSQAVSTPGATTSAMAPPPASGIPGSASNSAGFAQSFPHTPQNQFQSKYRQPGQEPMITNLSLATHPGLTNISRHFRMDLPPSPTMTQQSITINLPATHYYLQIKPTITPSLIERQYKLFVTSGNRLHAIPTIPGHPVDPRHPLFEARLHPGVVNRIEIELIAALPKGAEPVNGQDFELEKITVFANVSKS